MFREVTEPLLTGDQEALMELQDPLMAPLALLQEPPMEPLADTGRAPLSMLSMVKDPDMAEQLQVMAQVPT